MPHSVIGELFTDRGVGNPCYAVAAIAAPGARGAQLTPRRPSSSPRIRRQAIRELVRTTAVATQEQLRGLLAERGFEVTQATLSRDLARIGARHVSRPR